MVVKGHTGVEGREWRAGKGAEGNTGPGRTAGRRAKSQEPVGEGCRAAGHKKDNLSWKAGMDNRPENELVIMKGHQLVHELVLALVLAVVLVLVLDLELVGVSMRAPRSARTNTSRGEGRVPRISARRTP